MLRHFSAALRRVWNLALDIHRQNFEDNGKFIRYEDMARRLTAWRNDPESKWLSDCPVHTQQHVLKRLDDAYKRLFKGIARPPRFKKFGDEPSLRFPDPKQISIRQQQRNKNRAAQLAAAPGEPAPAYRGAAWIKLPKLGWMRLEASRHIAGEVRNATVSREGDQWFVCIQVELRGVMASSNPEVSLGIDLGLTNFAAFSESVSIGKTKTQTVAPLKALSRGLKRVQRAQKSVSRKCKGSKNRRKAVDRLARIHRRIAAQRADWLHKLSTELADQHPVIAIEDLMPSQMVADAGKHPNHRRRRNLSIYDAAWRSFRSMLAYKLQRRGGGLVVIDPAGTSQMCSVCGHCDAGNRLTQSTFLCVACGHTAHADINAAVNIQARGHEVWSTMRQAGGRMPVEGCQTPKSAMAKAHPRLKQESHRSNGPSGPAPIGIPAL